MESDRYRVITTSNEDEWVVIDLQYSTTLATCHAKASADRIARLLNWEEMAQK